MCKCRHTWILLRSDPDYDFYLYQCAHCGKGTEDPLRGEVFDLESV